jgi:hypothetical protein
MFYLLIPFQGPTFQIHFGSKTYISLLLATYLEHFTLIYLRNCTVMETPFARFQLNKYLAAFYLVSAYSPDKPSEPLQL